MQIQTQDFGKHFYENGAFFKQIHTVLRADIIGEMIQKFVDDLNLDSPKKLEDKLHEIWEFSSKIRKEDN